MTWARNFECFELAPTAALGSVMRPPSPLLTPLRTPPVSRKRTYKKLVHRQRTPNLQHWQIPPPPATNVILTQLALNVAMCFIPFSSVNSVTYVTVPFSGEIPEQGR